MPNSHLQHWQAEALRLSVFLVNPQDAISTSHWENLMASPPENVTRPSQMPHRTIEESPWENSRLQVEGQPGQIDWRTFSRTPPPTGPMVIGRFVEAADPFLDLMTRWLANSCPPVNRIAFGANLLTSEAPLADISRQLNNMLPSVTIDADGTRDFMYRINRRRQSDTDPSLQFNRLATWSAVQSIGLDIVIGPSGPMVRSNKEVHFGRLELDINTVPNEQQTIPSDSVPAVFRELLDAAREIADQGDIP